VSHREEEFKITRRLHLPSLLPSRHPLCHPRIRTPAFPREMKFHRNSPRFFCPLLGHRHYAIIFSITPSNRCPASVLAASSCLLQLLGPHWRESGRLPGLVTACYLLYLVITSNKSTRRRERKRERGKREWFTTTGWIAILSFFRRCERRRDRKYRFLIAFLIVSALKARRASLTRSSMIRADL